MDLAALRNAKRGTLMASISDFGTFSPEGRFLPDEKKSPDAVLVFLEDNPAFFSTHATETTALIQYLSTKNIIVKRGNYYPQVKAQFQKLFPDVYGAEVKVVDAVVEMLKNLHSGHELDVVSSFTDVKDRIRIALQFAEYISGPVVIAKNIDKFRITEVEDRIRIALACSQTQKGAEAFVENLDKFQLTKEEDPIKVVLEFLKDPMGVFVCGEIIDKLIIANEDDRVRIIFEFLKASGGAEAVAGNIDKFKIEKEEERIRIALECVKTAWGAHAVAENIDKFKIEEEERIRVALECVQTASGAQAVAENIDKFKIEEEEVRKRIVLECLKNLGFLVIIAKNINKFQIADEGLRIKIALEGAKTPEEAVAVAKNIKKFHFTEEARFKIALEFAKTPVGAAAIAKYINKFNITKEEYRIMIARECAKTPEGAAAVAKYIGKFLFSSEENRIKVALDCAKTEMGAAKVVSNFHSFQFENTEEGFKVLRESLRRAVFSPDFQRDIPSNFSVFELLKCSNDLFKGVDELIPIPERINHLKFFLKSLDLKLNSLFKNVETIKNNPELQSKILLQLAGVLFYYSISDDKTKDWIKKYNLIDQIFSLKNTSLIKVVISGFKDVAQDESLRSAFESTLSEKVESTKSGRTKQVKISTEFYLKNILLAALQPEINLAQLKKYADRSNISGLKKDALKMQRLLETLCLVIQHKAAIGEALPSVLERLFADKVTDKKVVSDGIRLQGILQLNGYDHLMNKSTPFNEILLEKLKEVIPLGVIKDFNSNYENTLAKFREFALVSVYAGKLNSLPDKGILLYHYARFIQAVLEGNFLEVRQNNENNPHLMHLEQNCHEVLRAWHAYPDDEKEVELLLGQIAVSASSSSKIEYRNQLKDKLVHHQHLPLDKIPELTAYLKGSGSADAIKISPTATPPYDKIQTLCLELIEGKDEKETLELLKENLASLGSEADNFKNDVEGFLSLTAQVNRELKGSYSNLKMTFTNDPNDYLLCGTEVIGSCQSITAGAQTNKCLLGYLLDGKNRIVVIKDAEGKIVTRSVVRILWDDTANIPVLFQERAYSSARSDFELEELIYKEAKVMAGTLHIPYASFKERPKNPLSSLGGPVPYEYSDSAHSPNQNFGVYEMGLYTIS
jgi:chromosome condensin MukBEF MukE localization factor